jgi:hypothetical protein
VAAAKGLADVDADAASATFFDYDHDGDLDLFLTSHLGSPTLPLGCPAPKVRLTCPPKTGPGREWYFRPFRRVQSDGQETIHGRGDHRQAA